MEFWLCRGHARGSTYERGDQEGSAPWGRGTEESTGQALDD